ncbi:MAG TPA: aldehyde dehydrogenase family protein, partial [Ignavibacteriaceae bacterium]
MMMSVNPATGKKIKSYRELDFPEIEKIITSTDNAFQNWKVLPFSNRSELMRNAASVLRKNKKIYSQLMTDEMGKPIKQSIAEVEKCAWVCEYYAENAEKFLADEIIPTDAK